VGGPSLATALWRQQRRDYGPFEVGQIEKFGSVLEVGARDRLRPPLDARLGHSANSPFRALSAKLYAGGEGESMEAEWKVWVIFPIHRRDRLRAKLRNKRKRQARIPTSKREVGRSVDQSFVNFAALTL
jgi:hypothetical protein